MIDSALHPLINHSPTFFLLTNLFNVPGSREWMVKADNRDLTHLCQGLAWRGGYETRLAKKYIVYDVTYSEKYFPPYVKKPPPPSAFLSFQLWTTTSEDLMSGT